MATAQSPTSRSRQGPGTSWIVEERERPGLPPWWFILAVLLLGATVSAVAIVFGAMRPGITHAERLYSGAGGAWGIGHNLLGLDMVRVLIGIVAGATVVATGFVARRFTHSAGMGILAAVLVALDPGLLVDGQLAVPAALLRFAAVSSLAMALGGHPAYHWLVPVPLLVGMLLDPWFLVWGAAIVLVLLFRGHIFAAPKHLRDAVLQGVVVPAALFVPLAIAIWQTTVPAAVACAPRTGRALLLMDVPHYAPGFAAVANPVVALGGLGLLLALAVAALVQIATRFRLARLPGRVQIRLPTRLGRTSSRVLWLALLALAMPGAQVAVVVGAIAIALGVQALMEDSPVFAGVVAGVTVAFAAVVVVRLFPVITGEATQTELFDLLEWLPWVRPVACG